VNPGSARAISCNRAFVDAGKVLFLGALDGVRATAQHGRAKERKLSKGWQARFLANLNGFCFSVIRVNWCPFVV
jgi:hypothetical protein